LCIYVMEDMTRKKIRIIRSPIYSNHNRYP
jgi:hypothetical protein